MAVSMERLNTEYASQSDYNALLQRVDALEALLSDLKTVKYAEASSTITYQNANVRFLRVGNVVQCIVPGIGSGTKNTFNTICTIPNGFKPTSNEINLQTDFVSINGNKFRFLTNNVYLRVYIYTNADNNISFPLTWFTD